MNKTTFDYIGKGLKMYEASVHRMKTAKPDFAEVFDRELANIIAARAEILELQAAAPLATPSISFKDETTKNK